jgi:hypothetical protein
MTEHRFHHRGRVPPVGQQLILPGLLIGTPPGPATAVLIDAQVRHRGRPLLQHRVRGGGERLVRDRPRHPRVPGRLGRSDPPLRDLRRGLLPQPPCQAAPRRDLRKPLGERLARTGPLIAFPVALHPAQVHPVRAAAHIPRPRQHILMHPPGRRRTLRAHPRRRMIGDRPYLHNAAGAGPASVTCRPATPNSTDAISWAGAGRQESLIVTSRDHGARARTQHERHAPERASTLTNAGQTNQGANQGQHQRPRGRPGRR